MWRIYWDPITFIYLATGTHGAWNSLKVSSSSSSPPKDFPMLSDSYKIWISKQPCSYHAWFILSTSWIFLAPLFGTGYRSEASIPMDIGKCESISTAVWGTNPWNAQGWNKFFPCDSLTLFGTMGLGARSTGACGDFFKQISNRVHCSD